jgi:hypothetical protein
MIQMLIGEFWPNLFDGNREESMVESQLEDSPFITKLNASHVTCENGKMLTLSKSIANSTGNDMILFILFLVSLFLKKCWR